MNVWSFFLLLLGSGKGRVELVDRMCSSNIGVEVWDPCGTWVKHSAMHHLLGDLWQVTWPPCAPVNQTVSLFTSCKPDAASGKSWLRQKKTQPPFSRLPHPSLISAGQTTSNSIWSWSGLWDWVWLRFFSLFFSLLNIIQIVFGGRKYGPNYCLEV